VQTPIVHITGARPNFPKAAPVIRALDELGVEQSLVHTGQHYDNRMSDTFFEQLGLPRPDINLGVGSGSHARQTGAIMAAVETLLESSRPLLLMVYGDVNSTVAATLTAAKLGVAVAHVEAGLRSFDRNMPEEINRVVTDSLSDLLFTTSPDAIAHLSREGVPQHKIHLVGNPMIDTLMRHLDESRPERVAQLLDLPEKYAVATLHRPANVDSPSDLKAITTALSEVQADIPLIIPMHPRSRDPLRATGLLDLPGIQLIDPLGYLEFISLMRGSQLVITDSGGVQEETTVLGIPCFTLRSNTERPVTISHGTNRLIGTENLALTVKSQLVQGRPAQWPIPPLWDGQAGPRIARVVERFLAS
jgi:UDP-N-acetylglucosamine 2-epimerase (non-hydrolysing)